MSDNNLQNNLAQSNEIGGFKRVNPSNLAGNFFTKISSDWMLVTVKDKSSANPMTASWGGVGHIWGRDVTFAFIRKSRHTYTLMEQNDYYALCFFEGSKENRKTLAYCGKKSGRDFDKAKELSLEALNFKTDEGAKVPFWAESNLVFICRKMHFQDIEKDNFVVDEINGFYEDNDYHRMYIGEIVAVLEK